MCIRDRYYILIDFLLNHKNDEMGEMINFSMSCIKCFQSKIRIVRIQIKNRKMNNAIRLSINSINHEIIIRSTSSFFLQKANKNNNILLLI